LYTKVAADFVSHLDDDPCVDLKLVTNEKRMPIPWSDAKIIDEWQPLEAK